MIFSKILRLNCHPFVPPFFVIFVIVANNLKSILSSKKILAVCQLTNDICWIFHNNNHLLCCETLRLAVHGVARLCEPNSTRHTGLQLTQVTSSDSLVKCMVDVCIRPNKYSSYLLNHLAECRIAGFLKRLDRDLVETGTEINSCI